MVSIRGIEPDPLLFGGGGEAETIPSGLAEFVLQLVCALTSTAPWATESMPRSGIMGTMVRIVAGVAGGRRLAVPPHGTRPTSDRVREAVFNALQARRDFHRTRVLDLYAGSGALGLEARSRGAAHVRFVESDRHALAVLRRNVEALGLGGPDGAAVQVSAADVPAMLRSDPGLPYDMVLADPPYALVEGVLGGVLKALVDGGWLAPTALLVVERSVKAPTPAWPVGVSALTYRRYGDTVIHYGVYDGCPP